MALNIVVCVKQVIDPETPSSAFKIDADAKKVVPPAGIPRLSTASTSTRSRPRFALRTRARPT